MHAQALPIAGTGEQKALEPGSVQDVQEIVRDAVAESRALEPVGGGTQLHVGYPPDRPLTPIALRRLDGIVEYNPADLVVVARAGTTIASLQAALAEHGQTLPLRVGLPERQTLGGIVASRASSLTRGGFGAVRDWLIGCQAVGGDGQVIVGGGKVVKNVAGYDLPKLYCGSWGTLGIITQVAFKLAPLPAASRTILVALAAERNSEEALDALSRSAPPLTFVTLMNASAAGEMLGADSAPAQYMVIGLDGLPEQVDALCRRAEAALAPFAAQAIDLPSRIAERLRSAMCGLPLTAGSPLLARCNILPSQVGAFARMLEWTARRSGFAAWTLADGQMGTLWAGIAPEGASAAACEADWARLSPDLRDKIDRVGGNCVFERMPDAWHAEGYPIWSPVLPEAAYMHRLKSVFDPHSIFRPGRFFDRI